MMDSIFGLKAITWSLPGLVKDGGEDEQDCMAELQKILAGLALVTKMEYIVEDREVLNG